MNLILIVDDIEAVCEQYAYDLGRLTGYDTIIATGGREALEIVEREPVDCMILDLEMPGIDGLEVLKRLHGKETGPPVIVYTSKGNFDRCVQAVKLGAYNFIDKSEPMERVVREIENALEQSRLASEVAALRRRLGRETPLIGESRAIRELKERIARVAPIPSPVLIIGESGSGKELVAREIHRLSGRNGIFLAINSAALSENLVESELFGHERGAFTGADRTHKGAFERASGGTLFLDEIGEVTRPVQMKLLRVLEEHEVMRVGGDRPFRVDTRVVAATNKEIDAEVAAGRFREDLLFRLNVHVLRVPPLRDRRSDIPLLVDHLLSIVCDRIGVRPKRISPEARSFLSAYDWRRNNVRELSNILEWSALACCADEIDVTHLPREIVSGRPASGNPEGNPKMLRDLKAKAERRFILEALDRNGWQISQTAAELGLADHASLLKIMRRHGLKRS